MRRYYGEALSPYYRVKVLVVGRSGAGKTATLRQVIEGRAAVPVPEGSAEFNAERTVGVVQHRWGPNPLRLNDGAADAEPSEGTAAERGLDMSVWDVAGQDLYKPAHQAWCVCLCLRAYPPFLRMPCHSCRAVPWCAASLSLAYSISRTVPCLPSRRAGCRYSACVPQVLRPMPVRARV